MNDILNNEFIWIPFLTWLGVQTFKVLTDLVKKKKFDVRRIVGSGGMPSSHSALVMSLVTCIAISEGLDSAIFAVSFVFAAIVMYDAAGVRRAAGKQARVLNQIIASHGKEINVQEKLKELLGHTPLEVFVGAIVGIIMGLILYNIWI